MFFIPVCKENFYKETRGTHVCIPCPDNTVSENTRTRCECKKRHYRNTENGPCQSKQILLAYVTFRHVLLYLELSKSTQSLGCVRRKYVI